MEHLFLNLFQAMTKCISESKSTLLYTYVTDALTTTNTINQV